MSSRVITKTPLIKQEKAHPDGPWIEPTMTCHGCWEGHHMPYKGPWKVFGKFTLDGLSPRSFKSTTGCGKSREGETV